MSISAAMHISSSGLLAGRTRLEVAAGNLANLETTQTPQGGPYRRHVVELESAPFAALLSRRLGADRSGGVRVAAIRTDEQTPLPRRYDPGHPDADEAGFVTLPNVNLVTEMTELVAGSRYYEANMTAYNIGRQMQRQSLELGR